MPTRENFAQLFKIGDLVAYIAYQYTPDLYYADDYEDAIGIVIEIEHYGDLTSEPWLHHIFWFDTQRITAVVAGHIRIISRPST
jgi:hypothetical protein